ncbi:MAG: fibrillarin-like rRNA/tRNA 2'-O-methyltransferase [Candidatus ainarchaeum sp.]|nr:fibrillarin-like rRNA/tRNA 2'-O-methyltransferase [Candidatus ainarchaeum sp.]
MKQIFSGIFESNGKIFTKNLVPGKKVYGEALVVENGLEYREWVPWRSKLCAGIKNSLKNIPLKEGGNVLYLGSAEGTTPSHVSDIIGENGLLFGVDIAEKVMRKFVELCELRKNMLPILADAGKPETYAEELEETKIELLYQDISQKNQAEIFNKNAELFLKKGKFGIIVIKAKSISQSEKPEKIFAEEKKELEKQFNVLQQVNLAPFEKHHCIFLCEKK